MALDFRTTVSGLPWETTPLTPYDFSLFGQRSEWFRVVRVASGSWNDPVRCFLTNRELRAPSDGGPYKALSYVWGSPRVTDTIYVDELPINVTLNLFCALKFLRHANFPGQDIILWVDSLCINQQDADERGSQVRLMKDIYQNAAEVIVFIGDGRGHRIRHSNLKLPPPSSVTRLVGDARDEAFCEATLKAWCSSNTRGHVSPAETAVLAIGLVRLLFDRDNLQQVCAELMGLKTKIRSHVFECLRIFLVSPWWSRIWVVQEIAVSTAATVHYGTVSVPWPVLVGAAKAISDSARVFVNIEPENLKVLTLLASQVWNIERTRSRWHKDGGNDLVRLLQEFSNRQAGDDRDKVYGILSLASPGHGIMPNYHYDVLETYRITALSLLNSDSGLNCWFGDQKRKNHKELPSWIPDWSTAFDPADMLRMTMNKNQAEDAVWRLHIVDEEVVFWHLVEQEANRLLQCLLARPSRRLPLSVVTPVTQFIEALKKYWYGKSGVITSPRVMGSHMLEGFHGPYLWNDPPSVRGGYYTHMQTTYTSILGIISTCESLVRNCANFDPRKSEIEPFSLFQHSFSFRGKASWFVSVQQTGPSCPIRPTETQVAHMQALDFFGHQKRQPLDAQVFAVQSIKIDLVEAVGLRMVGWSNIEAILHTLAQWWILGAQDTGDINPAFQDIFCRALLGDHDTQARGLSKMIKWLSDFAQAVQRLQGEELSTSPGLYSSRCEAPPSPFLEAMQLATDGRVFFRTTQGSLGLGPASMRPGDDIHALPGGTSHFVLRQRPEISNEQLGEHFDTKMGLVRPICYELIGDCHLATDSERPLCTMRGNLPKEDDRSFIVGSLPYELLGVMGFGSVVGAAGPGRCQWRDIRTIMLV